MLPGIAVYVKEVTTESVLKSVTAKQKGVDIRLSTTLESSVGCIVKKVWRSLQTIAKLTEAVIDNHGLIASPATHIYSEQQKFTDKKPKFEERRWQYVDTGMIRDPDVASEPSGIDKKPPADIFGNIKTN